MEELQEELKRCHERELELATRNAELNQELRRLSGWVSFLSAAEGTPAAPNDQRAGFADGEEPPLLNGRRQCSAPPKLNRSRQCSAPSPPGTPVQRRHCSAASAVVGWPQRLSLETQLLLETPPPPSSPWGPTMLSPASPEKPAAGCVFSVTVRKVAGCDLEEQLGVTLGYSECGQFLLVQGIRLSGTIDAWNRLCSPEKRVAVGDWITGVNDVVSDAQEMLAEFASSWVFKLTLVRAVAPPPSPSILRADAAVFVPLGVAPVAAVS